MNKLAPEAKIIAAKLTTAITLLNNDIMVNTLSLISSVTVFNTYIITINRVEVGENELTF